MSLPYSEGSVFLVPLKDGGFARGVVARSGPEGKVLFGYFFTPRFPTANYISFDDLHPNSTVLRVVFGALRLIDGTWPVIGSIPNWDRTKWPMPDFIRRHPITKKAVLVRRSDTDPNLTEFEFPIDADANLPEESLYGAGAVVTVLSKLVK